MANTKITSAVIEAGDREATSEERAYREALRNITDNYTSLEDVVWPIKPA